MKLKVYLLILVLLVVNGCTYLDRTAPPGRVSATSVSNLNTVTSGLDNAYASQVMEQEEAVPLSEEFNVLAAASHTPKIAIFFNHSVEDYVSQWTEIVKVSENNQLKQTGNENLSPFADDTLVTSETSLFVKSSTGQDFKENLYYSSFFENKIIKSLTTRGAAVVDSKTLIKKCLSGSLDVQCANYSLEIYVEKDDIYNKCTFRYRLKSIDNGLIVCTGETYFELKNTNGNIKEYEKRKITQVAEVISDDVLNKLVSNLKR